MKKEKKIRTYQRRTKTGKLVTVKQHTAKYDAAEKAKEMLKKKGAGDELSAKKKTKPVSSAGELDFSQADFKAWYHWDQENDPKNPAALKVEKALKAKMGAKGYRKYFNDMSDSYSARGHLKAYKECSACGDKGEVKTKVAEPKSTKTTETKKGSKASEDFKVKDTTLRRIDRMIKKLENPGKMWGKPQMLESAAKARKEKLRDLKKAKQYLENGDRIKAGRILASLDGRGHSGFDKKEFFTKEEIKSYNDKAAKKEAKKTQAAYDAKIAQAKELLAEHEKKTSKTTKTTSKSSEKTTKATPKSSKELREELKTAERREYNATVKKHRDTTKAALDKAGVSKEDVIAYMKGMQGGRRKWSWHGSEGVFKTNRMADGRPMKGYDTKTMAQAIKQMQKAQGKTGSPKSSEKATKSSTKVNPDLEKAAMKFYGKPYNKLSKSDRKELDEAHSWGSRMAANITPAGEKAFRKTLYEAGKRVKK